MKMAFKLQKLFTGIKIDCDRAFGSIRDAQIGFHNMHISIPKEELNDQSTTTNTSINQNKQRLGLNSKSSFFHISDVFVSLDWKSFAQWKSDHFSFEKLNLYFKKIWVKGATASVILRDEEKKKSKPKKDIDFKCESIEIEDTHLLIWDERTILNKRYIRKDQSVRLPTIDIDFFRLNEPLTLKNAFVNMLFKGEMQASIDGKRIQIRKLNENEIIWKIDQMSFSPIRKYLITPLNYISDARLDMLMQARLRNGIYDMNFDLTLSNVRLRSPNSISDIPLVAYFSEKDRVSVQFALNLSEREITEERIIGTVTEQILRQMAIQNQERIRKVVSALWDYAKK